MKYNKFEWADVFAIDYKSAKSFYTELFGWKYIDQHEDGMYRYSLSCLGDSEEPTPAQSVAGLAPCYQPKDETMPWNWGCYIMVENVDKVVDKVRAANGKIFMGPMDVMQAGRMAVCIDATGSVFHLWQPKEYMGEAVKGVAGSICWFELSTPDPECSAEFYREVFGWSVEEGTGTTKPYQLFKLGDDHIATMHARIDETRGQGLWLPYIRTVNTDKQTALCTRLGGSVVYGPVEEPGIGRFAVVADLESNMFGLAEFFNQ